MRAQVCILPTEIAWAPPNTAVVGEPVSDSS
jgi:hypothetical protein